MKEALRDGIGCQIMELDMLRDLMERNNVFNRNALQGDPGKMTTLIKLPNNSAKNTAEETNPCT